ncbi:GMC oxidoreductase [Cupriavidus taiwanensis]|uniref:Glucose-methanol-choline oxidoreductase C-terminal domain-containing protein n=1 Tax=Cupriavidus taiwanensis TaxID=164546 RepID=A0A375J8X3_9BURK|nr:GMC oxidoreductase [Cupriavidus taiwanensis]SPS01557.1 hypothetical protein CBM2634_B50037 [Cupriavidus taiwanensis]
MQATVHSACPSRIGSPRPLRRNPGSRDWWKGRPAGHRRAGRCRPAGLHQGTGQTSWHPLGTCKMGVNDMAVVDPELGKLPYVSAQPRAGSYLPATG